MLRFHNILIWKIAMVFQLQYNRKDAKNRVNSSFMCVITCLVNYAYIFVFVSWYY